MEGDYDPLGPERREHEAEQARRRIRREIDAELRKLRDDGPEPDDE
jgi:hypothetical protein